MNLQTVKPRARVQRIAPWGWLFWAVEGLGALGVGWTLDDALDEWHRFILENQTERA